MGLGYRRPTVALFEHEMDVVATVALTRSHPETQQNLSQFGRQMRGSAAVRGKVVMLRRLLVNLIDFILGWKSRRSSAVSAGRGTSVAWRRVRNVSGNRLSI